LPVTDDGRTQTGANEHFTAVLGMVGAGQLAQMTQRAAIDLGVRLGVLAQTADDTAVLAGATPMYGSVDDVDALRAFAGIYPVVTFDHELVPPENLTAVADAGVTFRPSADALKFAQDKLYARTTLQAAGVPVPPFMVLDTPDAVAQAIEQFGPDLVVKAARGGYDGRGVMFTHGADEANAACAHAGVWFAEPRLSLAMEVAVLCARRPSGEMATYPVIETVQDDGILVELVMPARLDDATMKKAVSLAHRIIDTIDAIGTIAVELFITTEGDVVLNELALRPHNSGHATLEATTTSQFHNHLRAVLDWPLGDVSLRAPYAATVNLIGGDTAIRLGETLPQALIDGHVHVHWYNKTWRPGRKLGHVTVLGDTADDALTRARAAAGILMGDGSSVRSSQ